MVGIMTSRLFTIEQIELIRRLRNSGITKDQVIEAFDQLDRLDSELGKNNTLDGTRRGNNSLHNGTSCSYDNQPPNVTLVRLDSVTSSHNAGGGGYPNHRLETSMQLCARDVAYGVQSNPHCGSSVASNESLLDGQTCNGEVSSPSASSIASPTSRLPSELTIIPISPSVHAGGDFCQLKQEIGSSMGVPLQCLVNPLDLLQEDDCAELDELKKKGEDAILSEIRNFVMRYNIKQTMIAEMTKMSQAYVSRFFRGDISDMSDRTKNTFYMWYLTCKHNPWKLAQMCPNSGVKRMVSDTGDLIPLKRERFTFKAAHLSVLERYYEKDPYPDGHTREQIVDECNKAVERSGQERLLSDRERVTLPVVNNWFNNRRKEAKKQMRQQHAAAMAIASGMSSSAHASAIGWNCSNPYGPTSQTISSHLDLTCEVDSDNSGDSVTHYGSEELIAIDMGDEDRRNVHVKNKA